MFELGRTVMYVHHWVHRLCVPPGGEAESMNSVAMMSIPWCPSNSVAMMSIPGTQWPLCLWTQRPWCPFIHQCEGLSEAACSEAQVYGRSYFCDPDNSSCLKFTTRTECPACNQSMNNESQWQLNYPWIMASMRNSHWCNFIASLYSPELSEYPSSGFSLH